METNQINYQTVPIKRLKGLGGLFLSNFFRRVAIGLIGLYVPIYIWQTTGELIWVAGFYLIYGLVASLAIYPGALIIRKIGVDWANVVGTIFRGFYILLLILAKDNNWFLGLSAISFGLCQPFDFLSYNYVITKISKEKKRFGMSAGLSFVVDQAGAAMGPLLGGLIILRFGFDYLYLIAALLLSLTAIFPFLDSFEKKGMYVSSKEIKKAFSDPGIAKHFLVHGIRVFDMISNMILWPLYLYLIIGSISGSGMIQTVSVVMAMVIAYFTGKLVDAKNFGMMYVGAVVNFFGWIIRFLSGSGLGLGIANSAHSLGTTMLWTAMGAMLMARSSKKHTMEFWIIKEIISYIMAFLSCLFYVLMFLFITEIDKLVWLFPLVGLVSLLGILIPRLFRKYVLLIGLFAKK